MYHYGLGPAKGPIETPPRPHAGVLHFDERMLGRLQNNSLLFYPSGSFLEHLVDTRCHQNKATVSTLLTAKTIASDATRSVGTLVGLQQFLDLLRPGSVQSEGTMSFIRYMLNAQGGQRNAGVLQLGDTRAVPLVWTQVWSCCDCSEETGPAPPQPGGAVTLWRTALHRPGDCRGLL